MRTQDTQPAGYQPIAQGEINWTQRLDENFQAAFAYMDGDQSKGIIEELEREFRPRFEELQTRMDALLADKVIRDEFLQSQQKQDFTIESLKQGMDAGFTGTSVIFAFSSQELGYWKGWNGESYPEGAVNAGDQLTN